MKTKKSVRIGCLLLVVLMLLGTITPAAFAVENDPAISEVQGEAVDTGFPLEDVTMPAVELVNPIVIHNAAELEQFLQGTLTHDTSIAHNHGHFILYENGNFDMTDRGPFQGRGDVYGVPFAGIFDGNGQAITGLRFTQLAGVNNIGFFQTLGSGAVVRNLNLVNTSFVSTGAGNWATAANGFGFVAGNVAGGTGAVRIENVTIPAGTSSITIGTAVHSNTRLGGLVGRVDTGANLYITDVNVHASIQITSGTSANFAGGLLGENNGNVRVSTNELLENIVNISTSRTGTALFANAGGVVGRSMAGNVIVENTRVLGNVDGGLHAGGVIGYTATSGSVTIRDTVVGNATAPRMTVTHRLADGTSGGFIGLAANQTVLERVTNNANIHGTNSPMDIGGLIGRSSGQVTINDGTNSGQISRGGSGGSRVGGLVGRSTNRIEITNGLNTGELHSAGGASESVVGGMIGRADHPAATANQRIVLENVVNRGNSAGGVFRMSGGIIGQISGGNNSTSVTRIVNAQNHGLVRTAGNATASAGGIVGRIDTQRTFIGGGTVNFGSVESVLDGRSNTIANRNAHIGGIVGNIHQDASNVHIHQAGNYGRVRGIHRLNETGAGDRGGQGGIVGRTRGAGLLIQEVFNFGHISSADTSRWTGGIVGHMRAGLTIEDFVSAGTTNSTGSRSRDSGVIGWRTSGNATVRRGYVAGRSVGVMV